jgi:AcrR family transcriptional regulator
VLALQRQSRKGTTATESSSEVYALADEAFEHISLRTVEEVRTQLANLEPTPFPAEALANFLQQEMQSTAPGEEVFLVSHPDAMESLVRERSWQQLAAKCLLHAIQVDRHGMLMMSRHTVAGSRTLAQAQVDLDALLKDSPERRASVVLTDEMARLPSFYKHYPWPLFYPLVPSRQMAFEMPQTIRKSGATDFAFGVPATGHVGVTHDRCVCYWASSASSGRVL